MLALGRLSPNHFLSGAFVRTQPDHAATVVALRPEHNNTATFYDQNPDRRSKTPREQFGEMHDHNSARNTKAYRVVQSAGPRTTRKPRMSCLDSGVLQ